MAGDIHLFEAFGIEIEYMIVDADGLSVRPVADQVLKERAGEGANEWENGAITWCNELVNHLLEFKTTEPAATLEGLAGQFQSNIDQLGSQLNRHGARLLPGGMHPWMDPGEDARLWPLGQNEIYRAYDRIFGCRGHGWSNVQSMQLNLPFSGDDEFARLHAATRLVVPLLPALAASTPYADGRFQGFLDYRMEVYRTNSDRIPAVTADVVPETVHDMREYREHILAPMYRAIAPHDPDALLQEDWLNSRGAIARFDRMAIEIRVIDSQECARADMAIAEITALLVRALVEEAWSDLPGQQAVDQLTLVGNFMRTIREAEAADISSRAYLETLGILDSEAPAHKLWGTLVDQLSSRYGLSPDTERIMDHVLRHGTLARRLLRKGGPAPDAAHLAGLYHGLGDCLASDSLFEG